MNRSLMFKKLLLFIWCSLFLTINLGASESGSSRYRDKFSPEREESVEEGEGDGKDDRGTKGGKSGRKKKRDDDVVIPFGLEEKAPSKVFLEIEHGEIIATSYTGFTEHEPAWEPIVWSPLSDSWDRDSLGVSIQRELVEPVENNGILWSSDGHHSLAPEIGQDLGLGDTGVLLIGFAGQLSIQGSARSIIRSIGILRPGAVAVAAGRALSAAARLAPRVGHRVTPVAMISAPSFIILDTAMRPRSGNDCGFCDKRLRDGPFPWSPRTIHEHPSPPPVNPTTSPIPTTTDPGVPPDSTITSPGLPPDTEMDDGVKEVAGPGTPRFPDSEGNPGDPENPENEVRKLIEWFVGKMLELEPHLTADELAAAIVEALGGVINLEEARAVLRSFFSNELNFGEGDEESGPGMGGYAPFVLPPIFGYSDATEEDRDQLRESLRGDIFQRYGVGRSPTRNTLRHHISPIY